jgi:hypothetical protein
MQNEKRQFAVITSSAGMVGKWGGYRKIGLVSYPEGGKVPTRIANSEKLGHKVEMVSEKLSAGRTIRSEYQFQLAWYRAFAENLNSATAEQQAAYLATAIRGGL